MLDNEVGVPALCHIYPERIGQDEGNIASRAVRHIIDLRRAPVRWYGARWVWYEASLNLPEDPIRLRVISEWREKCCRSLTCFDGHRHRAVVRTLKIKWKQKQICSPSHQNLVLELSQVIICRKIL